MKRVVDSEYEHQKFLTQFLWSLHKRFKSTATNTQNNELMFCHSSYHTSIQNVVNVIKRKQRKNHWITFTKSIFLSGINANFQINDEHFSLVIFLEFFLLILLPTFTINPSKGLNSLQIVCSIWNVQPNALFLFNISSEQSWTFKPITAFFLYSQCVYSQCDDNERFFQVQKNKSQKHSNKK